MNFPRARTTPELTKESTAAMQFSLRTLLVGTVIIACFCAATIYCLGPVLPESALRRLKPGTSENEVVELLGPPNSRKAGEAWYYERLFNPGWVTVYSDTDGRVLYVDSEAAIRW